MNSDAIRAKALALCVVLLISLTSCGTRPSINEGDQGEVEPMPNVNEGNQGETDSILVVPKLAFESQPARSVAVDWYYEDAIQNRFGSVNFNEMVISEDSADAVVAGLDNGIYDVVILPGVFGEELDCDQYETLRLFEDAIVFIHGNPTPPNVSYDLTLETIRNIYNEGGNFFWDETQMEPIIPTFWFNELAEQLEHLFDIRGCAKDIFSSEGYDNPVMAASMNGVNGAVLFPVHYSFLGGYVGVNGDVISVDGVLPTENSIADGTYPLSIVYYAVYSADNPIAEQVAIELKNIVQ